MLLRLLSYLMMMCAVPALGAETAWVELTPGVSARLVSADAITQEGRLWMGLEIDMPADTKTYWRVPGEAGIPLEIDVSTASALGPVHVAWPFPEREVKDGYLDHSYYGRVLIPFSAEVTDRTGEIIADISLGICSDICVPAVARLQLVPDFADPDAANAFRIDQALAQVPLPHEGADVLGAAIFDQEQRAVLVERRSSDLDVGSMIAELDGQMTVFDIPHLEGDQIVFPVLGRIKAEQLEGGTIRFSYQTSNGPFEITRPLTSH